jgi:hypothetical protein
MAKNPFGDFWGDLFGEGRASDSPIGTGQAEWPQDYDTGAVTAGQKAAPPLPAPFKTDLPAAAKPSAPTPAAKPKPTSKPAQAKSPTEEKLSDKTNNCGVPPWIPVAIGENMQSRNGTFTKPAAGQYAEAKPDSNPRILEYFKSTSNKALWVSEDNPWCGAFVNWVLKNTPANPSRLAEKGGAAYRSFPSVPERASAWSDFGRQATFPKVYGAITTIGKPKAHHVTFAVGVKTNEDGEVTHIVGLGGNQSGGKGSRFAAVRRSNFPMKQVKAFVFPPEWPAACDQDITSFVDNGSEDIKGTR